MRIAIKRVYDNPSEADGVRILVDRLWPRGVSREAARIHRWLRDLSPSEELRRWFDHDPARWNEFKRRYFLELDGHRSLVESIRTEAARGTVTLLYAAREQTLNNASALREFLKKSEP
ncbi:MAG: hypothetical protein FLDDKLPJ_03656 [Phycisphaerae bacterium]|nr:hypothetical protein [Phycisphaerae bacterium]